MAPRVPRFAVPTALRLLPFCGTLCTVLNMSAPDVPPTSFAALIERWETMADFSKETNQPYERVKRWRALNSIKPKYWPMVKAAAFKRGWYWCDDAFLARLAAETERTRLAASSEAAA